VTIDTSLFDGTGTSADERRHFLDVLALSPASRLFEAVNGSIDAPDESLDAVLCIDAIARVPDRAGVLADWARSVKPGGPILYTDPAIVAGLVTRDELAIRSSMGFLVFSPQGENEFLIESAGLRLLRADDATDSVALVAARLRADRARDAGARGGHQGRERYDARQRFLDVVHRLASERRLARIAFLTEKAP
jgi:SAM-dependent methyltransferase